VQLPIRTRLTLVFAGLAAALLGVAAAALLIGFRAELARTVDDGLRTRLASMAADPVSAVEGVARSDEAFAQFVDEDGMVLTSAGLREPLLSPSVTEGRDGLRFFDGEVRTLEEEVPVRILAAPVGSGGTLVLGVDVEDQREAVARLTALVAIGGPILLAAVAVLGWLLAGAALRPVERLRAEAAALSSVEPSRRLPVPATGDELQRLAETLNAMLDRMHEALDRERRLIDEASHELRTPLGVLKAEVDLALKEPRTREELEAALRSISEETERIRRLTQDLLVLARFDRGRLPVHRADVDVSDILERVAGDFADRARSKGVDLRTSGERVRARVDADRVRQAVENLVDNALRHTGSGGTVEVGVDRDDARLRIVVSDTGAGFPLDLLERAFEPFSRADDERAADGAGLGLAIVRAVAEAHGGSTSARNLDGGGAAVALDLPS
jgi:two-component system, OmpR family, sensor kinase